MHESPPQKEPHYSTSTVRAVKKKSKSHDQRLCWNLVDAHKFKPSGHQEVLLTGTQNCKPPNSAFYKTFHLIITVYYLLIYIMYASAYMNGSESKFALLIIFTVTVLGLKPFTWKYFTMFMVQRLMCVHAKYHWSYSV